MGAKENFQRHQNHSAGYAKHASEQTRTTRVQAGHPGVSREISLAAPDVINQPYCISSLCQ